MSVGRGAEGLILEQVKGLGSRTMIIEPGREPKGPSDFFGDIYRFFKGKGYARFTK